MAREPAGQVVVVARYTPAPGAGDQVAEALQEYTPLVRSEPGCLAFTAHRSATEPDHFVLIERYGGRAEFDAHVASTHYAEIARDRIRPLLADRSVDFYNVLEP